MTKPATPDPINHAKIDPETPVNPKLVSKAMTAPKTIRSFFKPISESERRAQVEAEYARQEAKRCADKASQKSSQDKAQSAKGHVNEDNSDDEPMVISESSNESSSSMCNSPSVVSTGLVVSSNLFKRKSTSPLEKRKSKSPLEKRKSTSPLEKCKSKSPLEKCKSKSPHEKRSKSKSPCDKQGGTYDESTDEEWCPDDDFENGNSSSLTRTSTRRRGLRSQPRKDYVVEEEDSGAETPTSSKGKLTRKCKACKKAKTVCACKTDKADLMEVTESKADSTDLLEVTESKSDKGEQKLAEQGSSPPNKTMTKLLEDDGLSSKSSTKPSSNETSSKQDSSPSNKTPSKSPETKDSSISVDAGSATKVSDTESSLKSPDVRPSTSASDSGSSSKSSDTGSSSTSSENGQSTKDPNTETLGKSPGGSTSTKSKESDSSDIKLVGKKRPLKESNSKISNWFQPAKKTKQCSIASSFARVTEAKQKKVVCPVCEKELPSGTSNEQLNVHVDKCLQG